MLSGEKKKRAAVFGELYEYNEQLLLNLKFGREDMKELAKPFRFVSDVLEGLIRIGAGQPVYGAGTAAESAVESTVVARAAEGGTAEIVFGTVEATESSEPAGAEAWTEEEIRRLYETL